MKIPALAGALSPQALTGSSRRLKVLHLGKFYPPHLGGMESHLETLCRGLSESVDLQVIVASDDRSTSKETLDGIPITRLATQLTLASTPLCPGMMAKIRDSDADIVHLHWPNPAAVLAYLASGHRGRLMVTYHSDTVRQRFLGPMFQPFLHAALRRCSAIIAASPNYIQSSSVLERYQDRCHLIPFGIALEDFERCDQAQVDSIRSQFGSRLLLSVGRFVYYKGFEYLIRAMTQVSGSLVIVGDGPLRDKLAAQIHELGLSDRVHLPGQVSHEYLVSCYHAARAFILPSIARSEAFGIVQIEAMASGTPVINTQLDSGVPFVSLHGETGLTVPPANSAALAAAINQLLDDDSLRQSFGSAAHQRARQEFSREVMLERTVALYRAVSDSPK